MSKRPWAPDDDAILGTDTDAAIAKAFGRSAGSVSARRKKLGIPASQPRGWSPEHIALLGKISDAAMASLTGKSKSRCKEERQKRGIKSAVRRGFSANNCRWYLFNGKAVTITDLANLSGWSYKTVWVRLSNVPSGVEVNKIITIKETL